MFIFSYSNPPGKEKVILTQLEGLNSTISNSVMESTPYIIYGIN